MEGDKKGGGSSVRKIRSLKIKIFVNDSLAARDDSFHAKEISLRKRL